MQLAYVRGNTVQPGEVQGADTVTLLYNVSLLYEEFSIYKKYIHIYIIMIDNIFFNISLEV